MQENQNRITEHIPSLESFQFGFSINDCIVHIVDDNRFFVIVANNGFLRTIREQLILAAKEYPDKFGTGNANDVLDALFRVSAYTPWGTIDDYVQHIMDTYYCYVVYNENNNWTDVLKIDLLRRLKEEEFLGGLFHTLKHFSVEGRFLSTGKENQDVFNVEHIVYLVGMAFRDKVQLIDNQPKFETIQKLTTGSMRAVFYKDSEMGVYFLNTYFHDRRLDRIA